MSLLISLCESKGLLEQSRVCLRASNREIPAIALIDNKILSNTVLILLLLKIMCRARVPSFAFFSFALVKCISFVFSLRAPKRSPGNRVAEIIVDPQEQVLPVFVPLPYHLLEGA